jgi:hypothetical protein
MTRSVFVSLLSAVAAAAASANSVAGEGICLLYANDADRSFFFSGVSPAGDLVPQLLSLPTWDALLVGLDAGEDDDVFYIVPQGVASSPNMTVATLRTAGNGTATISYATLGAVPGFSAPYVYMNTLHLDSSRNQMIATLVGVSGPPPDSSSPSSSSPAAPPSRSEARNSRRRAAARATSRVGDPGDLFFVVADVFPGNGTVATVRLDLSEDDMRWGDGVLSGVSAFDGVRYWVNPVGGQVPSGQALYGFPLNGSAPTVIPYGPDLNLGHLFYSTALQALLGILEDGTTGIPTLVRVSPPSANFTTLFTWPGTDEDWGTYDVSKDGSHLVSVLVTKGGAPSVSVVSLLGQIKEVSRIALKGFNPNGETVCDINFCNV